MSTGISGIASAYWEVGDLAVCLRTAPWINDLDDSECPHGPQAGGIHRVATIARQPGGNGLYLGFDEWPDDLFESTEFRRIKPDMPTVADREVAAIKRLQRDRVPA